VLTEKRTNGQGGNKVGTCAPAATVRAVSAGTERPGVRTYSRLVSPALSLEEARVSSRTRIDTDRRSIRGRSLKSDLSIGGT
jgi:hypothetical protein